MSHPDDSQLEAVDRLLAGYLQDEAERADSAGLLARIGSQLPADDTAAAESSSVTETNRAGRSNPRWRWLLWPAMTAAAVILAFLGGRHLGPSVVNASTVLHRVRTVHSGELDRCYRVQFAPDPRYWNRKNKLDGPSESILWTRGDRFWADCTIGDIKLAIGSNEHGTLWVSPSRSKGIRFADSASQLPANVALLCAINSMTVPALVDDVLADFDLRAEAASEPATDANTLIWARLKPGRSHPLLSAALLEIDADSRVLVRLVLWTVRDGHPKGTVTYTLLGSDQLDDAQYRLQTHLDADAAIEVHSFQGRKEANQQIDQESRQ